MKGNEKLRFFMHLYKFCTRNDDHLILLANTGYAKKKQCCHMLSLILFVSVRRCGRLELSQN